MSAVKISRSGSSSRVPSWQCSANDRSAEWNCSIVSPLCFCRVSSRYLSNVTFLGLINVNSSSYQMSFVVFVSTFVWGNFLLCIFLPSMPRLRYNSDLTFLSAMSNVCLRKGLLFGQSCCIRFSILWLLDGSARVFLFPLSVLDY